MRRHYLPYYRRLRFSSDADIMRLTNARIIIIIIIIMNLSSDSWKNHWRREQHQHGNARPRVERRTSDSWQ